jgi:hypothetical protein
MSGLVIVSAAAAKELYLPDGTALGTALGASLLPPLPWKKLGLNMPRPALGAPLGLREGWSLGAPDGARLGASEGASLGAPEGATLGASEGASLGAPDGARLGVWLGLSLGAPVGVEEGESLTAPPPSCPKPFPETPRLGRPKKVPETPGAAVGTGTSLAEGPLLKEKRSPFVMLSGLTTPESKKEDGGSAILLGPACPPWLRLADPSGIVSSLAPE